MASRADARAWTLRSWDSAILTAPQPKHQTALEILTALTDTPSRFAVREA